MTFSFEDHFGPAATTVMTKPYWEVIWWYSQYSFS